jgi:hypothetical protein
LVSKTGQSTAALLDHWQIQPVEIVDLKRICDRRIVIPDHLIANLDRDLGRIKAGLGKINLDSVSSGRYKVTGILGRRRGSALVRDSRKADPSEGKQSHEQCAE